TGSAHSAPALGSTAPASAGAPALLEDVLDTADPVPLARSASSSCSPSTATCRNTQHHLPKSTWEECGCSSPYACIADPPLDHLHELLSHDGVKVGNDVYL